MNKTFADRLNAVFRAFPQPPNELGDRREWTNGQLARAAEKVHGRPVITSEHLRLVRIGKRPRPSAEMASAIARAFAFLSERDQQPGDPGLIASYLTLDPDHGEGCSLAETPDDALRGRLSEEGVVPAALDVDVNAVIEEAMRKGGVEQLAFRARGLSESSLKLVLSLIENARTLEGLEPGEGADEGSSST